MTTAKPEPDSLEKIIHEMRQNVGPQPPIMHGAMWDILQWAARLESLRGAKADEGFKEWGYVAHVVGCARDVVHAQWNGQPEAWREFIRKLGRLSEAVDELEAWEKTPGAPAPPERFSEEERRALLIAEAGMRAFADDDSMTETLRREPRESAATLRSMLEGK